MFLRTGQPVAINGRYLLPVLLPLLVMGAIACNTWLGSRTNLKLMVVATAIIGMLWGGGALTYVLRSYDSWYGPSPAIRHINYTIQHTVGPLVPGYRMPTLFLR